MTERDPRSLRGHGLSVGYGASTVLDAISFEFRACQTSVILGPGGSGKSTLLKVLASAAYPRALWWRGALMVPKGRPAILPQRAPPDVRSLADMLADSDSLPPREKLRGIWSSMPAAAAALSHVADTPILGLSEMTARLAQLTVAVATYAPWLVLDEPDAELHGDPYRWVTGLLSDMRGKRTVVMVTHNLETARRLADFVLFLVDGKVIEAGDAHSFFNHPRHARTKSFLRMGS